MSKMLTLEIAQKFLNRNFLKQLFGGGENLMEYTSMDDAAAQALAQHEGDLGLSGLTSLSDAAAQALAQHKGGLYLDGLTNLSDAAAQALAKHEGGYLDLRGLTSLSDAAAQALAQHKGWLNLRGAAEVAVNLRKRLPQTAQSVVPSAATGTQLKDSATKPDVVELLGAIITKQEEQLEALRKIRWAIVGFGLAFFLRFVLGPDIKNIFR